MVNMSRAQDQFLTVSNVTSVESVVDNNGSVFAENDYQGL